MIYTRTINKNDIGKIIFKKIIKDNIIELYQSSEVDKVGKLPCQNAYIIIKDLENIIIRIFEYDMYSVAEYDYYISKNEILLKNYNFSEK